MEKETLFSKWQKQEGGYTNFGGYQTSILQAYQKADMEQRRLLEIIYPAWFSPLDRFEDAEDLQIYTQQIAFLSKNARVIMNYVFGHVKARIQDYPFECAKMKLLLFEEFKAAKTD